MRSGIGRALVHSTAGTAVTRLLGALAGVCIARLLDPAARGDLAILVVLASVASVVGAAQQLPSSSATASVASLPDTVLTI